jgi:hypothetical protein
MVVTKKSKTKATPKNVDVEALIRKGGSVASEAEMADGKAKVYAVVLRLPVDLAQRIDQAVHARRIKMPRHTWLLEAAMEKLELESS